MKCIKSIWVFGMLFLAAGAGAQEIRKVKVTEVEQIIKESRSPLIVNMWATWCQPCIEEIPYFMEVVNKHNAAVNSPADSVRLILVSLDFKEAYPSTISVFAQKRKFTAEILWLDETNADYFCPKIDPKWSGAIPATLFVNHKTGYRNFFEEQLSRADLEKEVMAILKKN